MSAVRGFAQNPVLLVQDYENEFELTTDQIDTFNVRLVKGGFFEMIVLQKGVDVIVDVYNPSGQLLQSFDSPTGETGNESVSFEPLSSGLYRIDIHHFINPLEDIVPSAKKGKYLINSVKVFSPSDYKRKLKLDEKRNSFLIGAITKNVIPLKSVNSGTGFEDLQPLKAILKDVKYVGLGEATHGTREFFQMKHRMLEFLVREMGFSVFAIEASYSACQEINDYIINGEGEAKSCLKGLNYWIWNTEEVLEMIEWMKTYNQSVSNDYKIKFTGFDIVYDYNGIDKVKSYLAKVDTIRLQMIKPHLDSIYNSNDFPVRENSLSYLRDFLSFFTMSKGIYVRKSSDVEYEMILNYLQRIVQFADVVLIKDNDSRKGECDWRDYYMASNFLDIASHEKSTTKFVIWAHNSHVSKNPQQFCNYGISPMGSYLREIFTDKYYSLGIIFNKGCFRAYELDSLGKYSEIKDFIVSPAKNRSFEWYFSQANQQVCILDFKIASLNSCLKEFLDESILTRQFGAGQRPDMLENAYQPNRFNEEYNGVIFINETTSSRPVTSEE